MNRILRRSLATVLAAGLTITSFAACTKQDGDVTAPSEGYTIDNIRDYVVGLNEPVELEDGTEKVLINFDNAAISASIDEE